MLYLNCLLFFLLLANAKDVILSDKIQRRFPEIKAAKVSEYDSSSNVKIVNGVPTTDSMFPWMASIKYAGVQEKDDISYYWVLGHFCGGSIIQLSEPPIILTAAHCLDGQQSELNSLNQLFEDTYGGKFSFNLAVDIGRTNVKNDNDGEIYATVEVENWYIHQDYNKKGNTENDIGIMYLDEDIDMTMAPNAISITWDVNTTLEENDFLRVIGYGTNSSGGGLTPTLEYTDLEYVEELECNDYLNLYFYLNSTGVGWQTYNWSDPDFTVLDDWEYYDDYIKPGMICGWSKDSDSCQGDSGGPLIDGPNKTSTQVGIVSWGLYCAHGTPGVYTSVDYFRDWLNGAIDCVMCDGEDEDEYCTDCKSWKKTYGEPRDRYNEDGDSDDTDVVGIIIGILVGIIVICVCIGIYKHYKNHKLHHHHDKQFVILSDGPNHQSHDHHDHHKTELSSVH